MDTVKRMWAAYCEAAGGVTYDGKPLPTWEELGDDRQKCWMAAGKEVTDEIERLRKEKTELMFDPSVKMLLAGKKALFRLVEDPTFDDARAVYEAMIAAHKTTGEK